MAPPGSHGDDDIFVAGAPRGQWEEEAWFRTGETQTTVFSSPGVPVSPHLRDGEVIPSLLPLVRRVGC